MQWIQKEEAEDLVKGKTDKPYGVDPAHWFKNEPTGTAYALGRFPLSSFTSNEAGERYDGTVDLVRAKAYAKHATQPPPVLCVLSRDGTTLRILDGGHRISAARLRGDTHILAILRAKNSQIKSLMQERDRGWRIEGTPWVQVQAMTPGL